MKYLILIIAIFLTSCKPYSCPLIERADIQYKDKVVITKGFYKGLEGEVIRKSAYDKKVELLTKTKYCEIPSYNVEINKPNEKYSDTENIRQDYLKVIAIYKYKKKCKTYEICKKCEQPKIEPTTPVPKKEDLTCESVLEKEAKNCKDINCKLEILGKLRRCPRYEDYKE
jgi:hypothetical protein